MVIYFPPVDVFNRIKDVPFSNNDKYIKYHVSIQDNKHEIVFYKNKESNKWWMEVPCYPEHDKKYERHYILPCSYSDYQAAINNEMPDKWWQTYQKLTFIYKK